MNYQQRLGLLLVLFSLLLIDTAAYPTSLGETVFTVAALILGVVMFVVNGDKYG